MADDSVKIKVTGVRDLQKALYGLGGETQRELRPAMLKISTAIARLVAGKVPARSGKAAGSVKPRATQKGASITVGGARAPHYPWLDFGGSTHVPGAGGRVRRSFVPGGRYLYPTIAEENPAIRDAAWHALNDVAERHGLHFEGGVG